MGTATRAGWRAAAVATTLVAFLVLAPASVTSSGAAGTNVCPSGGLGGPFLRICSSNVFAGGVTAIGASAEVSLPCTTSDFVVRRLYKASGDFAHTTTDEGYAYFAFYSPSDEVEIGFFHNDLLPTNGYSLYVRHGNASTSFWNISPDQAVACGSTVNIDAVISFAVAGEVGIQVSMHNANATTGELFNFVPKAGASLMMPNEIPLTSATGSGPPTQGQAIYPAGKGGIAPLAPANWSGGCSACGVATLTAVAQNGLGSPPTLPLQDGASFGPVSWRNLYLIVGDSPEPWSVAQTGATVKWREPEARFLYEQAPPNYTVSSVTAKCQESKTGADRWKCGNGIVRAKP